jgi:peptide/nickel transport system permease protein
LGARWYLARRVFGAFLTLFFVLTVNFFLFRIMPGDPVSMLVRQQRLTPAQQEEQIRTFGLDRPLHEQYVVYLANTLQGDLGRSGLTSRPVTQMISERIWPTVLLVGAGTLISIVVGLLAGIYGAWHRGSALDKGSLFTSLFFYSLPEGWFGMMLILIFVGVFGIFPAGGYRSGAPLTGIAYVTDVLNHLVLPLATLTLGYIGSYAIVMRSSLLEVLGEEYITTARAKGLAENQALWRHAVPNAVLPSVTLVLYSFGYVVGGSIVIEYVFSYPGLGGMTASAVNSQDFPLLQGMFLLFSASVIFFNLVADLLYGYFDPRVRET